MQQVSLLPAMTNCCVTDWTLAETGQLLNCCFQAYYRSLSKHSEIDRRQPIVVFSIVVILPER